MPEETSGQERGATPGRLHRRALALLGSIGVVVVLLDLITKQVAAAHLDPQQPVRLLGGALYLSLARNSGAAFSLFRDYTFVFPLIAVAVIGWLAWMSRRLRSTPWAVSLGLILGGVVGNLIDRLFRAPGPFEGYVVDFLSVFKPYGEAWPIFNVADMSLVTGVCLAVLLELLGRRRDGSRVESQQAADGGSASEAAVGQPGTRGVS